MKITCATQVDGLDGSDGRMLTYTLDVGKRKKMSLVVEEDGEILVRIPMTMRKTDADKLIAANVDWIKKARIEQAGKARLPVTFEEGEKFSLLGKRYTLHYEYVKEKKIPVFDDTTLTIYLAQAEGTKEAESIFTRFIECLALEYIKKSFDKYEEILDVVPNCVTVKEMKTRWGSCSSQGNISINVRILCFEQRCIDYVVVHELCHLKHMNHGNEFWRMVETCCPDHKEIRKILRQ